MLRRFILFILTLLLTISVGNAVGPVSGLLTSDSLNRGLLAWWMYLPRRSGAGTSFRSLIPSAPSLTLTTMATANSATSGWGVSTRRQDAWGEMRFDGVDDALALSSFFGNPATMTIAAWIAVSGWPAADGAGEVISFGDTLSVRSYNDGSIVGFFFDGTNWNNTLSAAGLVSANNRWRHVVYTCAPGVSRQALYLDGNIVATTTFGGAITYSGTAFIGRQSDNTVKSFNGMMDDIRLWKRELTAGEVRRLAKDSQTGYTKTLNDFGRITYKSPTAITFVPKRGRIF